MISNRDKEIIQLRNQVQELSARIERNETQLNKKVKLLMVIVAILGFMLIIALRK